MLKPAVTVRLLDAFGNIELGSTNQVTLAASDSSLTLARHHRDCQEGRGDVLQYLCQRNQSESTLLASISSGFLPSRPRSSTAYFSATYYLWRWPHKSMWPGPNTPQTTPLSKGFTAPCSVGTLIPQDCPSGSGP